MFNSSEISDSSHPYCKGIFHCLMLWSQLQGLYKQEGKSRRRTLALKEMLKHVKHTTQIGVILLVDLTSFYAGLCVAF